MGKHSGLAAWIGLLCALAALSVSLWTLSLVRSGYHPIGPSLAEKVYGDFDSQVRTGYTADPEHWLVFESLVPGQPEIGDAGWSLMAAAPDPRSAAWRDNNVILQRKFRYPKSDRHVRVRIEMRPMFQALGVSLIGENNKGIGSNLFPQDFVVGRTMGYRLKDAVLLIKPEEVQTSFADVESPMPGFNARTFQKVWFNICVIPFSSLKVRSVLVSQNDIGEYIPSPDEAK